MEPAVDHRDAVVAGRAVLGIELGSTRVKAVLIGDDHAALAAGTHAWENQLVEGTWTYSLDAVRDGLRASVAELAADVRRRWGVDLRRVRALGVSAMMHGYLALDADDQLLTPFRTWRNTSTARAAEALSAELRFNVPHRWSVAHLYQALLDGEEHVERVAHLTTLAGYVHHQLTGERVLGVGDASGMFPVAVGTTGYDTGRLATFDRLAREQGFMVPLERLLPRPLPAGAVAGRLTEDGARLLDPTGRLGAGAPLCPPEGDAGTGMVATGSVRPRTGNVSVGTSVFAMVVLERPLERVHPEVDLVTTPAGDPVAMVHCNNGASELEAWVRLFVEFAALTGTGLEPSRAFEALLGNALDGAADGGGLLAYNYLAGEPVTEVAEGRPLVLRLPGSRFDLATFFRAQLCAVFATLRVGMDVLLREEQVGLDRLFAHGGLFATPLVAQRVLAAALDTSVSVGDVAAEGGAWGAAVLAAFSTSGQVDDGLAAYLDGTVFRDVESVTVEPDPADVAGFDAYTARFTAGLAVQRSAAQVR